MGGPANRVRWGNRPHPGVRGLGAPRVLRLSRLLRPRYAFATIWIVRAVPAPRSRSPRTELRTGRGVTRQTGAGCIDRRFAPLARGLVRRALGDERVSDRAAGCDRLRHHVRSELTCAWGRRTRRPGRRRPTAHERDRQLGRLPDDSPGDTAVARTHAREARALGRRWQLCKSRILEAELGAPLTLLALGHQRG